MKKSRIQTRNLGQDHVAGLQKERKKKKKVDSTPIEISKSSNVARPPNDLSSTLPDPQLCISSCIIPA